jgi:hypothetical protein
MLPGSDIAPDREEELEIVSAAELQPDAIGASQERDPAGDAAAPLDPAHLGHGVHAHGDDGGGMHVGDAALPGPSRTGAGLGGLQIGDTRF